MPIDGVVEGQGDEVCEEVETGLLVEGGIGVAWPRVGFVAVEGQADGVCSVEFEVGLAGGATDFAIIEVDERTGRLGGDCDCSFNAAGECCEEQGGEGELEKQSEVFVHLIMVCANCVIG